MGSKFEKMKSGVELTSGILKLVGKIDHNFFNPEHPKTYDDKKAAHKQYRLMAIPNPRTRLNLGEWVSEPGLPGIGKPFGFPGISMDTKENFYANIEGQTVFQSKGQATFQSDDVWTQFAKALSATYDETVTMTSGHGMFLTAGPQGVYSRPPDADKALAAPAFNGGSVHALVLHHFTSGDNFLLHSLDEIRDVHEHLGLKGPETPKRKWWARLGKSLDRASQVIQKVQKSVHAAREMIDATAETAKKAKEWQEKHENDVEQSTKHGDKLKAKLRTDYVALAASLGGGGAEAVAKGIGVAEPWVPPEGGGGESKSDPPKEAHRRGPGLDDLKKGLGQLDLLADELHTGIEDFKTLTHTKKEIADAESENKKHDKKKETTIAKISKTLSEVSAWAKNIDKLSGDLTNALSNHAFKLATDDDKPQIHMAAEDDIHISSGSSMNLYAQKGFSLQTDQGDFLLHTKGKIETRALESAEITAKKQLLLESEAGTELASKGAVIVGSRKMPTEVLGPWVRLGSMDPKESERDKHSKLSLGEWDHQKQDATLHLTGVAKTLVAFQAGGKAPGIEKAELDSNTPAAIRLKEQDGSAEVWAKTKIAIEADEKAGEVRINVGDFVVEIKNSSIHVGKPSSTSKDGAWIHFDKNGVWLASQMGTNLILSESKGSLTQHGSTSSVELTKQGTNIKGTKINLG